MPLSELPLTNAGREAEAACAASLLAALESCHSALVETPSFAFCRATRPVDTPPGAPDCVRTVPVLNHATTSVVTPMALVHAARADTPAKTFRVDELIGMN